MKTAARILGVIGGIIGIFSAVFVSVLFGWLLGSAEIGETFASAVIVFSIFGIIGGIVIGKKAKAGGALMLTGGIGGFIAGNIIYIIAGIMLIIGGILALRVREWD